MRTFATRCYENVAEFILNRHSNFYKDFNGECISGGAPLFGLHILLFLEVQRISTVHSKPLDSNEVAYFGA